MVERAYFRNVGKRKEKKTFIKHFFSVFEGALLGTFEHTKTFFLQNILPFSTQVHEKSIFNNFVIIHKTKHACCQNNIFDL